MTPTWSVRSLFVHGVQVFNSAYRAELLAQHFERIHHLNFSVFTVNHARMVNRTVNKYFRRPYPNLTEAQLAIP
jgi:hypothetical protein